jgi:hypothetical protein
MLKQAIREGAQMNNLELTRWLGKVRDALAEPDEIRRNSMLRAAERFLKEGNHQSHALQTTRNRERGRGILDKSSSPIKRQYSRTKPCQPDHIGTEPAECLSRRAGYSSSIRNTVLPVAHIFTIASESLLFPRPGKNVSRTKCSADSIGKARARQILTKFGGSHAKRAHRENRGCGCRSV